MKKTDILALDKVKKPLTKNIVPSLDKLIAIKKSASRTKDNAD